MNWHSKQGFKIGKRFFLFPIIIQWGSPGIWTDQDLAMIKLGSFKTRLLHPHRSSGTCDTTTLYLEFHWKGAVNQLGITWRPDVTHEAWNKTSYRAKKHAQFVDKYGKDLK